MSLVSLTHSNIKAAQGQVAIVGAGPGDPDLLTIKALRAIERADVILFDALVSDDIKSLFPSNAERIPVGKRCGRHSMDQEEINQLLVACAGRYRNVVRLKGGDPLTFGRGGEEMQALAAADITYYVVPGVTAAAAVASYGAIPLTHRGISEGVTFVTGQGKGGRAITQWQQLAMKDHTLVIYMGIARSETIASGLMAGGLSPLTPVAIVSHASRQSQQVVTGKLDELSQLAQDERVQTPAAIVVGDVVKLTSDISWFEPDLALKKVGSQG